MVLPPPMQSSLPAGWLAFTGRELNPLDRYKRFQIIHPPFLDLAWRKGSFILHLPLLHITRSPHWRGRAASVPQWPSVFLGCAFVARKAVLKGLTLDHFT